MYTKISWFQLNKWKQIKECTSKDFCLEECVKKKKLSEVKARGKSIQRWRDVPHFQHQMIAHCGRSPHHWPAQSRIVTVLGFCIPHESVVLFPVRDVAIYLPMLTARIWLLLSPIQWSDMVTKEIGHMTKTQQYLIIQVQILNISGLTTKIKQHFDTRTFKI